MRGWKQEKDKVGTQQESATWQQGCHPALSNTNSSDIPSTISLPQPACSASNTAKLLLSNSITTSELINFHEERSWSRYCTCFCNGASLLSQLLSLPCSLCCTAIQISRKSTVHNVAKNVMQLFLWGLWILRQYV